MMRRTLPTETPSDVRQAVVHQVANKFVCCAMVGQPPLIARRNEAHAPQQGQLVTRRRQRKVYGARHIADSEFVVRQGVHE